MKASEAKRRSASRLEAPGVSVLIGTFLGPAIQGVLIFAAAGTMAISRAWLYLVLALIGMFGQILLVAIVNPELVNHRGRWKRKTDAKPWDRPLVVTYGLFAFYAVPVVAGLDIGRWHFSPLAPWTAAVGSVLFALGTVIITWAMLVNTHFETIVRIQRDRDHRVITRGPYAVVRHPGYVGASLWALSTPLILGSGLGLLPAGIATAMLVVRTALEDKTLQSELPGYADYAQRIRFRLLPGIW